MTDKTKKDHNSVPPIPEGMHSITPHHICAGAADTIEFYKKAFGAVELSRVPGGDGRLMHASTASGLLASLVSPRSCKGHISCC